MNNIRKKHLRLIGKYFLLYSLISIVVILLLFHIAMLSFPFLSAMWSYLGFEIIAFITLFELSKKEKIIFSILCFIYTYVFWCAVLTYSDLLKVEHWAIWWNLVNLIILISYTVFSITTLIKAIRRYKLQGNQKNLTTAST